MGCGHRAARNGLSLPTHKRHSFRQFRSPEAAIGAQPSRPQAARHRSHLQSGSHISKGDQCDAVFINPVSALLISASMSVRMSMRSTLPLLMQPMPMI